MLLKFRPDELRLILVDPKVVEMQPYSKLPHLIVPVVTDPKKVPNALRWCVNEMEHRYHCFAKVGVRNFEAFNKRPPDAPAEEAEEPEDGEVDEALAESIAVTWNPRGNGPRKRMMNWTWRTTASSLNASPTSSSSLTNLRT